MDSEAVSPASRQAMKTPLLLIRRTNLAPDTDGNETGKTSTSGEMEWDTGGRNGPRGCDISGFCKRWRK